ncbi:hypothetical protein Rs2_12933 [Raphanus sativus]|nr:hypothetical protein Rs2_12933 [Raphanus sativus]
MGKISFKSAFIVLLAFAVMISVTVQIVEGKRMLEEEKSLPLLDLQVSKLVKPQVVGFCNAPCKPLCFQFSCHCRRVEVTTNTLSAGSICVGHQGFHMVPPGLREAAAAVKPSGPLVVQIVGAVVGASRIPTGIRTPGGLVALEVVVSVLDI